MVLHPFCQSFIKMKKMNRHTIFSLLVCATIMAFSLACSGGSKSVKGLASSQDSLSYVVGMNLAYNILKMDSTLNADMVVAGINDMLKGEEKMSFEDAKYYFLAYHNYDVYERVRNYEEQFLKDLAASDNKIERTKSGLTYKVETLGDMNKMASGYRDTVAFTYRETNMAGEEVDPLSERADTLRNAVDRFLPGLSEGMKLIGEGGKISLWLPSSMAYGSAGDSEKGIKPNEMLRYDVQIVEVKKRR